MAVINVSDKGALKIKIPQKVKVGAMTYDVEIVPNMFADRSLFGEVNYANQTIKIAGDVSVERRFDIFVREVLTVSNMLTQVFVENGLNFGGEADE